MSRPVPAILLATALLLLPGAAGACSVCFSATEENRIAFIATTVFLSVLPLSLLGGIGWWLRRRVLEMEREHDTARERQAS